MTRPVFAATALAALAAATVSGCGGAPNGDAHKQHADAILSVAGLGTFEGRCPGGVHSWTVRFVDDAQANEAISYRVGRGARRTVNVDPGNSITIRLVADATRTHEPPDRMAPPVGQGRGRAAATSVPTTAPLEARIYQATEPQTLRADVRLALATVGGESGQCVLVGSTVNADTYPN